jgi:hypothetical protein
VGGRRDDLEGDELVLEDEEVLDREEVRVRAVAGGADAGRGAVEGGEGCGEEFGDWGGGALLEWGR